MNEPGRLPHWWENIVPKLYDHPKALMLGWLGRVWVLWRKHG